MTTPDVDLAYLAGVLDSDGHITIGVSVRADKRYYGANVGIAGTSRESHDLAASVFGGSVRRYSPRGNRRGHKPVYQWSRWGSPALAVVTAVQPYLRVKARHAQIVLDFWEQSAVGEWTLGEDMDGRLWEFVEQIRAINARTGRKPETQKAVAA